MTFSTLHSDDGACDTLRSEIITKYENCWGLNDSAHQKAHFSNVERCANYINLKLDLGQDPKLITYVAWFHDLFAWSRNNHHQMAYHWILTTDCEIVSRLTDEERSLVAYACLEHRASGKDKETPFNSPLAELMCAADREYPTNAKAVLARAINFRIEKDCDYETAKRVSIQHVKEKYGTGGYAFYPDLYLRVFEHALLQQREEIDALCLEPQDTVVTTDEEE